MQMSRYNPQQSHSDAMVPNLQPQLHNLTDMLRHTLDSFVFASGPFQAADLADACSRS